MFDVPGEQMAELLNLALQVALVLDDSACYQRSSTPSRLRSTLGIGNTRRRSTVCNS
jgi:hypothetical protein